MRRITYVAALVLALVVVAATPALACGGLVGENGTIQLTRTTTLGRVPRRRRALRHQLRVQRHRRVGGVDRAAPRRADEGGARRRLDPATARARDRAARARALFAEAAGSVAKDAEVLQQVQVDALDITILRGGGDAVGRWAIDHGFLLTPDAPEVLDFYSQRSKIFMAARFDASRAAALGQQSGDGTPIMLTIPTDEPWVPLRILALGLDATRVVDADVFLLTDERPTVLTADTGVTVARSEAASSTLLDDLRGDQHMGWVPDAMWLSYVKIGAAGRCSCATTSRCRPTPTRCRRPASPASSCATTLASTRGGWSPLIFGAPLAARRAVAWRSPAVERHDAPDCAAHRLVALGRDRRRAAPRRGRGGGRERGALVGDARAGVLGPGPVTVTIAIDHSRFSTGEIRVRPHTEVRFVLVNHDPIGHEFIVGGPEVHARHANGHEAYHPPVPGEVSVPADARASTTYVFHAPGPVEFACHLPGHYQYGMHGIVRVTRDGRPR